MRRCSLLGLETDRSSSRSCSWTTRRSSCSCRFCLSRSVSRPPRDAIVLSVGGPVCLRCLVAQIRVCKMETWRATSGTRLYVGVLCATTQRPNISYFVLYFCDGLLWRVYLLRHVGNGACPSNWSVATARFLSTSSAVSFPLPQNPFPFSAILCRRNMCYKRNTECMRLFYYLIQPRGEPPYSNLFLLFSSFFFPPPFLLRVLSLSLSKTYVKPTA